MCSHRATSLQFTVSPIPTIGWSFVVTLRQQQKLIWRPRTVSNLPTAAFIMVRNWVELVIPSSFRTGESLTAESRYPIGLVSIFRFARRRPNPSEPHNASLLEQLCKREQIHKYVMEFEALLSL